MKESIEQFDELSRQIKTGEIHIESVNRTAHLNEIEPQNNVRCWEKSGEETVTITIRKMKQWHTK